MSKRKAIKLTNFTIAILLVIAGIAFSITSNQIMPFSIGFTGAAILLAIYRNQTWDFRERKSFYENSLAEIKKQICYNCGALVPWWSEYCVECGETLPTEDIECQECHNLNPPKSNYCGICGNELRINQSKNRTKEEKTEEKPEIKEEETKATKPNQCPECGYEISLDINKCPWCGHVLNE